MHAHSVALATRCFFFFFSFLSFLHVRTIFQSFFRRRSTSWKSRTPSVSDQSALFPRRATMDHFSPDTVPACPLVSPAVLPHSPVTRPFSLIPCLSLPPFRLQLLPDDRQDVSLRVRIACRDARVVPGRQWTRGSILARPDALSKLSSGSALDADNGQREADGNLAVWERNAGGEIN